MKRHYIRTVGNYAPDGIYELTKKVCLEKDEEYTINLYTAGRYILTINGKYICEGPCKSHEYTRYYDSVVTNELKKGDNEIKITVMHITDEKKFTSVFKKQKIEFIFEAVSESNEIVSSANWICRKNNKVKFIYGSPFYSFIPPYEEYDYTGDYEEFALETFGNEPFLDGFDFEYGPETVNGIERGKQLEKRPIPMLYPGEEMNFSLVRKGKDFIELDAGKYSTSKVCFKFKNDVSAKIIYAESYIQPDGTKTMCDDIDGVFDGKYDIVKIKAGDKFCPFWFRAFRFIRIEGEGVCDALESVSAKFWHYPVKLEAEFECSDEYINKMFDISINTIYCCTHETFYDCPYYEQYQYVMDSLIEASVLMRMTSDTRIVKKCIEEFAASQMANGYLSSFYPSVFPQVIPGFTLMWIFMLHDYMEYSHDTAFAKKFIGTIYKILERFETELSDEGLVTRGIYWDFVDYTPGYQGGEPVCERGKPITAYSMYYAYALRCASDICKKTGKNAMAEEYDERYCEIAKNIKKHCFDAERGLYKDSGKEGSYSVHTIVWSILAELEDEENAQKMLSHMKDEDLVKTSFSMNFFLFRALEKSGNADLIFENFDGWRKMIDNHCTTWREMPKDKLRSECHAWSSAPLYEISSNLLGVKVGFEDEIIIKPTTAGLKFAKGKVPTRFGVVSVSWTDDENGFAISVEAPCAVDKKLVMPNGDVHMFVDSKKSYAIIK
ncbi:MAG: hypothetical protein II998_10040 [Clostridia bacterium]|nr:hypothetical protein [Clostridia bacterium]